MKPYLAGSLLVPVKVADRVLHPVLVVAVGEVLARVRAPGLLAALSAAVGMGGNKYRVDWSMVCWLNGCQGSLRCSALRWAREETSQTHAHRSSDLGKTCEKTFCASGWEFG